MANLSGRSLGFYTAQFFFGGWFLFHGLNYFLHFFPQPGSGGHGLIGALEIAGLFAWVKMIEVIVGIMLLANRFVPVAVVAAVPITFVIAYLNIVLKHDAKGLLVGVVILLLNGGMALGYFEYYRPMFVFKAGNPGVLASTPSTISIKWHVLAIVLGVAVPAAVTFASIM